MRIQYLNYYFAATAALCLGLGFSFWQSASENDRLRKANLTASIALEAVQDEAKSLNDKLSQEMRERRRAEASQAKAEASETGVSVRLMAEMKARQTSDAARIDAEAKLQALNVKLEETDQARILAEGQRDDASAKLAEQQSSHQAMESARHDAVATATLITAKLAEELHAIRSAEAALNAAQEELRILAALPAGDDSKLCKGTPELPVKLSKSMDASPPGSEIQPSAEKGEPRPKDSASAASPQTDVLVTSDGTSHANLKIQ